MGHLWFCGSVQYSGSGQQGVHISKSIETPKENVMVLWNCPARWIWPQEIGDPKVGVQDSEAPHHIDTNIDIY